MILSIHSKHDANLSIGTEDGTLKYYLEFEKIFNERYFKFSDDNFQEIFSRIWKDYVDIDFNQISIVNHCWLSSKQSDILYSFFPRAVHKQLLHHDCHAYSVYQFTQFREKDLIVSIDGGGDLNDYFKFYTTSQNGLVLSYSVNLNLGTPYRLLGMLSQQIRKKAGYDYEQNFGFAGKIMGLSSYGQIINEYIEPLNDYFNLFYDSNVVYRLALGSLVKSCDLITNSELLILDTTKYIDLIATAQYVFESIVVDKVKRVWSSGSFERLLLTGGCALNVKLNSKLHQEITKDIFVSPVPNDCGISLGAYIQSINIQKYDFNPSPFLGPLCYCGEEVAHSEISKSDCSLEKLAELLIAGNIIGIINGRIEAGPRALGNRSLIAYPHSGLKHKINKIKDRESYRPIAPIVSKKYALKLFGQTIDSPYMSFAPELRSTVLPDIHEVIHIDHTARLQTIDNEDSFLSKLISEVGRLTQHEIICNTSFNSKGKPITNSYAEAFDLFLESDIDYLYINEQLYSKCI